MRTRGTCSSYLVQPLRPSASLLLPSYLYLLIDPDIILPLKFPPNSHIFGHNPMHLGPKPSPRRTSALIEFSFPRALYLVSSTCAARGFSFPDSMGGWVGEETLAWHAHPSFRPCSTDFVGWQGKKASRGSGSVSSGSRTDGTADGDEGAWNTMGDRADQKKPYGDVLQWSLKGTIHGWLRSPQRRRLRRRERGKKNKKRKKKKEEG